MLLFQIHARSNAIYLVANANFTMRSLISNGFHTNPHYRILIRMHVNEMRSRESNHSVSLHLVAISIHTI